MTGHPSDRQTPHVNVMETPVVPEDDSLGAELRAELRSARELLAITEAHDSRSSPMTLPENAVGHPRLRGLAGDAKRLRDHIERLERDLRDTKTGKATLECLAEDAREDD